MTNQKFMPGKYTMKRFNEGLNEFMVNEITIKEATLEKYAQYPKSLKLIYVNRGERKQRAIRFIDGDIQFIPGWDGDQKPITTFKGGFKGFEDDEI